MKSHSRNILHGTYMTNVYGFYDMALSNQIRSQLLREDLHPTLGIVHIGSSLNLIKMSTNEQIDQ